MARMFRYVPTLHPVIANWDTSSVTNMDGTPRVAILNALVLHVGTAAIAAQQSPQPQSLAHSPAMDVYQRLVTDLGPEARYVLLNAIANQLRYPNNHTHYFSCVLLYLFAETENGAVQEQITRVLLERPHQTRVFFSFSEALKHWGRHFKGSRCIVLY